MCRDDSDYKPLTPTLSSTETWPDCQSEIPNLPPVDPKSKGLPDDFLASQCNQPNNYQDRLENSDMLVEEHQPHEETVGPSFIPLRTACLLVQTKSLNKQGS